MCHRRFREVCSTSRRPRVSDVRNRNVGDAVSVEIHDRKGLRIIARRIGGRIPEGTVAVAQKNEDDAGVLAANN